MLNYDIWYQIFLYLDLKSIYCIEIAHPFFQNVLERVKYWKIRIRKDFPHCEIGEEDFPHCKIGEERYSMERKVYWNLYTLNHTCNLCRLCVVDNVNDDIPESDWLKYLDWKRWTVFCCIRVDFQFQSCLHLLAILTLSNIYQIHNTVWLSVT